jgi:hypothetical protein
VLRVEQNVAADERQTKLLDCEVLTRVDQGSEKLKPGSHPISGWLRAGTVGNRGVLLNTATIAVRSNKNIIDYFKNVQVMF